jgi:hypothetical protein
MKKLLILAGWIASLSLGSVATTVIPMTVEQLTERSSHVVEAHATKNWSAWNPQHTMIATYTEFAVENWLKGSGQTVITVMQPGGSAEGYTQHVAGVHGWSSGESAVLFLQLSTAHDGTFTVSGLMQGNFRVRHLASGVTIADNGIASSAKQVGDENVQSFHPDDKSLTPYAGNRMDLTELKRLVRTANHSR